MPANAGPGSIFTVQCPAPAVTATAVPARATARAVPVEGGGGVASGEGEGFVAAQLQQMLGVLQVNKERMYR